MDINLPMSPPVNNSIEESVYDKLDAMAFEKTRVVNCQLDMRLSIQERTLNKYRRDVERVHENQSKRLRREFKKINEKKPDYVYDDTDLVMAKSRESHVLDRSMRQRSQSECSGINKGGHCKRYYSHHYHVKYEKEEKNKEDKNKPREKTDFFNLKLKMFFYNTMRNAYATQQRMKEEDENNKKVHNTHDLITLPDIPLHETSEIQGDTNELIEDDVFRSPRQTELAIEQEDTVHDELQNSTNSLWGRSTVNNETSPRNERHHRKRGTRTLRMYGSDSVLNHVHKKRESLDEKEFAKMREQWLQSRHSSDKIFAAIQ